MTAAARDVHWLDHVAALLSGRRRVFTAGWGDERLIARLADTARFEDPPGEITVRWETPRREGMVLVEDGSFDAPVTELPAPARRAVVRRLTPALHPRQGRPRPVYVVLASSGDEGWAARDKVWRPLVERASIEAVFLESAMYGSRRPEGQRGTSIRTVSEHLLMNLSMVEEARALLDLFAREGRAELGIAGYSMGGSMAALVAAVTPRPLAAAIFATGRGAGPVFTEGLLARGIDFAALGGEAGRARLAKIFSVADLDRHPAPRRPDAVVMVGARRDGYVFTEQVEALHARWKGSELRWLDTGHAGALLRHPEALRQAALDALDRLG